MIVLLTGFTFPFHFLATFVKMLSPSLFYNYGT
ncbi:unnamed protein product [Nezara viridula]|uniref:Uncharacterized protein n=1 Tax=Nezara viridula TaxID=85310 RepID=A0A9P0MRK2_NEZVI|nr:unnamed protein product [Nezara viridula]